VVDNFKADYSAKVWYVYWTQIERPFTETSGAGKV
jgi:hypothetical protein